MKDLWKAACPVGTEVDQLDTVYDGFNWNFKTLEEAFEEGGMLYGKTVYVLGGGELQLDEDAHKIINVPTVIVIESHVPPSDKLDIGSIQRGMEIIPMKQMGMEWVPYVPSENRDGQVDRMNSQIFSMRCTLTRDALRDMNEDDAKKFSYCRAYFYQPFEESEIEHDAVVDILFPSNPPVVCIFNWELQKLEFVSGTLLLHKAAVLESFHLNIASECSGSEVGLWVRIALDRFVRDLKISFYNDHGPVRLPSRLFRCETIETLELCRVIALDVPCRFSFRSLKKLRLLSVRYSDEESFSRFISNCPVLEDLVVETCEEDNVVTFTVNVASLQSLSISHTLRDIPNSDEVFVIHSHGLKQLKVVDYFGELNLIGNMLKLGEANLQYECLYAKVLEPFTSVKRLYLCLFGEAQFLTGIVLSHLVWLELCTCEDNWTNMLVSELQHAPKLQVLKLENQDHCLAMVRNVCWIQPERVPECFLYQLKTFEWRNYGGTQVEKEVAMYILKNASRLVTATIYPDSVKLARKHKMFEKLEIATRSSRACELYNGSFENFPTIFVL